PLIGIFVVAAFGLRHLTARLNIGPFRLVAAAGLVLAVCLLGSMLQVAFWRNDETLFTRALSVTQENGAAHNNLGIALGVQGRIFEARQHFLEAIRLYPL